MNLTDRPIVTEQLLRDVSIGAIVNVGTDECEDLDADGALFGGLVAVGEVFEHGVDYRTDVTG